MSLPVVYIGICPSSRVGVALAAYTARLSRMWAWDAESLEIVGFQDIKGRARLLDVSTDGEYVSYGVEKRGGYLSYFGVSRPPYFHALLLANAFNSFIAGAMFIGPTLFVERPFLEELLSYAWPVPERVTEGCPFTVVDSVGRLGPRKNLVDGFALLGDKHLSSPRVAHKIRDRHIDSQGRAIWSNGHHVYADEHPFLDLARQPFTEVVPPEWAQSWIAPRPK